MNAQLQNIWNLIYFLRPRKVLNAALIWVSYRISRILKRPILWGMPISMSVEPTTSCNLRCPQCPSGLRSFSRPTGMLQGDLFAKLIDEQASTLWYLTLYFQGEPYLNPEFLEMVKYANQKGIYTATSTNAHYLSPKNAEATVESGLNRLIISIDGIDQDSYAHYRVGGNLDKVLEGTRNMVAAKKKLKGKHLHIVWQFIVFAHNESQIPEIQKLAKEIGVDELAIKTAQIYDFSDGHELLPQNERYRRYTEMSAGFVIKNKLLNHCWRMWQSCVVTWDGKVVPCCFDKDATHQIGDLKSQHFQSVWKSEAYQNFRQAVLKGRSEIEICKNCSEGTKIWEA
ncbi:MAG: SPASM domain-containing protein [Bacteroidota bacterium]|nr:SPASM domain-containing protein [Bacteroidota bacterium]MDX5429520.1 SPASM domain-containing protein [Bacteroidota bacterium]MDX5468305.1 SPASM domain-containing protein [Bacteroidota bacterium]